VFVLFAAITKQKPQVRNYKYCGIKMGRNSAWQRRGNLLTAPLAFLGKVQQASSNNPVRDGDVASKSIKYDNA
jgi:hypothetical protein